MEPEGAKAGIACEEVSVSIGCHLRALMSSAKVPSPSLYYVTLSVIIPYIRLSWISGDKKM